MATTLTEGGSGKNKNMTVIHGENGSGKTSILNAFKWCFYGHTNFETGESKILNENQIARAKSGDNLSVRVAIEFEHESKSYTAIREQIYVKQEHLEVTELGGADFQLSWSDDKGDFNKSPNPETHMDQILPEKMQAYFFFDGEKIERLSSARSGSEIAEAIKNLMGIEIVERAANHLLKNVSKAFKSELKKNSAKELANIVEQEQTKQDEAERLSTIILEKKRNCIEMGEEIKAVGAQLEANKDTVKLEERRKELKEEIQKANVRLAEITDQRRILINAKGFLAFVEGAKNQVQIILDENRKKGQLPSKIRSQFVSDLLEEGACICSRPLTKGDEFYTCVEALKKDAGNEELDGAVIDTSADMKSMSSARDNLYASLSSFRKEEDALLDKKKVLNGQLDTLGELTKEVEDAIALQERRDSLEKKKDEELKNIGRLEHESNELIKIIKELVKERERLSKLEQKSGEIQKKIDLASELGALAQEFHSAASQATRKELSKRVNETFCGIMKKDYWAEINEDYDLQIYKEVAGYGKQLVYEKSTGENQITSLSFIGSLISIARERNREEGRQYFQGGIFPIVMDSPYGQLDDEHKQMVAKYVPELAEQVILMATSSQWKGPVEEECVKFVGKHVSLIHHAPKVEKESYYSRPGADFEYTEIEEGYHG